jgi:hypothetical protein
MPRFADMTPAQRRAYGSYEPVVELELPKAWTNWSDYPECPKCSVKAGESCISQDDGLPMNVTHPEREVHMQFEVAQAALNFLRQAALDKNELSG